MSRLLGAAAAALLLAAIASAAGLDPRSLVLTQADMPAGYRLDRNDSFVMSNARFSGGIRANEKLVARSGRITGYLATYERRAGERLRTIRSRTDVLATPAGARLLLSALDASMRKTNAKRPPLLAYGRERAGIGGEGWVHWSGSPGYFVFVMWRHGRVLGVVDSWGVGRERTLALARVQQRRLAAALR
jgi:hypothetical protein